VPAKSFEKITTRLQVTGYLKRREKSNLVQICGCSDLCAAPVYQQNKFGDEFRVFLLINPEDEKPVAVVVPRQTLEPVTGGNAFLIVSSPE
jgi:hypothetical protein